MNARFRLSIVALCIAGVLAGCGSVTEGIAFQPPAGWTGTPAMFGRFQMWMKNTGQDKEPPQMLMLIKGDANSMHGDLTNLPPQYSTNLKVIKQANSKICGGLQPAEELVAEGTDKNGKRSQVEMTSAVIGKDRYIAMYLRPLGMRPDGQAETAIHSLCPTK